MTNKLKPVLTYPLYSPSVITDVDLNNEISNRQIADASLATAISTEISTRTSADSSLATAIGGGSLSSALSTEVSIRTSADASLTTAVSTTTSQRISTDASLSTALSSKLSLTGGTLTGDLNGTSASFTDSFTTYGISDFWEKCNLYYTLNVTGNTNLYNKLYLHNITNINSSNILYYNSTSKEVTYYSTSALSVGYANSAGYTSSLYESETDSYVNTYYDGTNSNIWLQSDIGYAVSVDYASNAQSAVYLGGTYYTSYALKSGVLALSGGTLTGGLSGTTIYTTGNVTGSNIRPIAPITLSASAPVWNMNLSCVATLTLTASTSLSIINVVSGDTGTLRVIQGAGSYTLTMPTGTKKTSTITISTTNGAVDILSFVYIDGSYYFNQGKNYT